MNQLQYDHVEEAFIDAIDVIVYAMKKGKATPEEVAALPGIAFALKEIDRL